MKIRVKFPAGAQRKGSAAAQAEFCLCFAQKQLRRAVNAGVVAQLR